jgi:hypothetical protein
VEGGSGGSKGLNGGLPALFLGDGEGFIQSQKQHQDPSKSTQRRVIALEPRVTVCTELRAIRDGASMSHRQIFDRTKAVFEYFNLPFDEELVE